ncbi:MAG: serine/threonine-protein kinase [Myxococcota bacterium]
MIRSTCCPGFCLVFRNGAGRTRYGWNSARETVKKPSEVNEVLPRRNLERAVRVFEKYEIIRRLAVGGMGEIYLAKQIDLADIERFVILKSLLPDLAQGAVAVEAFLDEARVVATLSHPNIVSVYEVGLWEQTYFIAMEYIRGVSLTTLLERMTAADGRIPISIACRIIHDAAQGLHHAHRARDTEGEPLAVVHRDVSPHNLMVRYDGVVKVLDFGIAHASNRTGKTQTGILKGKLSYMAPEQMAGDHLDHRSDQYSLGVVFWELCTIARLFEGSSPIEIAAGRAMARPRMLEGLREAPAEVSDVIARMLSENREDRFEDCAAVATSLKPWISDEAFLAEFLDAYASDCLREPRDTQSKSENFVIDLLPGNRPSGEAVSKDNRRRKIGAAGVGFVLLLSLLFVLRWNEEETAVSMDEVASQVTIASSAPASDRASLILDSEPTGASVSQRVESGEFLSLGDTPLTIDHLEAKTQHVFRVRKNGFEPSRLLITLDAGASARETVRLDAFEPDTQRPRRGGIRKSSSRRSPEKSSNTGQLTLSTEPWTQVYLDGVSLGSTPIYRRVLPEGEHTLRFTSKRLGLDVTRQVTISAGEHSRVNLKLREVDETPR